ncbi:MAG: hypothetical protein IIA45_13900 [Bacteroidetes bacterium]|nr:hypothetical protein [Bacteroidota bacterium]
MFRRIFLNTIIQLVLTILIFLLVFTLVERTVFDSSGSILNSLSIALIIFWMIICFVINITSEFKNKTLLVAQIMLGVFFMILGAIQVAAIYTGSFDVELFRLLLIFMSIIVSALLRRTYKKFIL